MEVLKFKTNIKCGGCLAQVSPALNETAGKDNWEVDIANPEKLLTVINSGASENEIISAVAEAGFKAEKVAPTDARAQ